MLCGLLLAPLPDLVDGLPFVFVDRSLGRLETPALLRAAGIELVTLAEHYGQPDDQYIADVTWIAESAANGWVAFMKDGRIRTNELERQTLRESGARCFCLGNANVNAGEAARRYLDNLPAIIRACRQPGPFLYSVQPKVLVKLSVEA